MTVHAGREVQTFGRDESDAERQGLIDRLRDDLAGFTVDGVEQLLGPVAHAALGREQALPAVLVTREHPDDPVATLVAAFLLGRAVPRHRLAAALPTLGVSGAERLDLIETAGQQPDDVVRAAVEVRPHASVDDRGQVDRWIVSDLDDPVTGAPHRPDHVLGVGGASLTLAQCTMRTPVDRVLDLGTGCGVQALYAARHARHITGTDTSSRALAFARFAWQVNAPTLDDVPLDLRRGDLLEPVRDERFDLVVSNPPFVITPRVASRPAFEYRDAGLVGDALVERLVRDVGGLLRPGGVVQILANWEHRRGQPWRERVESWLDHDRPDGLDLDAWVVQREVLDPAEYAELWMRDAGQHTGPQADELYAAWLGDFAARRVDAVGFGLITLRRPAEGTTRRAAMRRLEDRREATALPTGHDLAAALAAHDWLADHDDEALLDVALTLAPDVTEERHHVPGEEDPRVVLLRRGTAVGGSEQASTALAGFVGACEGELTTGQIVGALGQIMELPVEKVAAEVLPAVRRLVSEGYLTVPA